MKRASAISFFLFSAVTYQINVKPILDAHCVECHSVGSTLDLSQYPFANQGDLDQQTVVEMVLGKVGTQVMPPGNRPKLEASEMATIKSWRDQGLTP